MGSHQQVPIRLCVGLVAIAVAMPFLVSSMAAGVVPQPQFNCVASQPASFSNPLDVTIPDASPDVTIPPVPVTSTINVSGLTGAVYDIDVVTKIPHTAPGDLSITLTSPSGKIIELSVSNAAAAAAAFNGTVWDDDADPDGEAPYTTNDGLVTDHNYVAGALASPLVPQEPLAAFAGDNPNGLWTLTVVDTDTTDAGLIDEWSVAIATVGVFTAAGGSNGVTPAVSVADGGTATTSLQMAAGRTGIVNKLSVTMNGFSYSGLGDLTMTLRSPSGTVVTLTSGNGGPTVIAEGFRQWVMPPPVFSGLSTLDPISRVDFSQFIQPHRFAPEESFGAFYGEAYSGTWTLVLSDAGLIPGGGGFSSALVGISGAACAGDAQLVSFSGPVSGTRIGAPVVYEATVKSTGPGHVHDIALEFDLPRQFRISNADPGPGGSCGAAPLGRMTCSWRGPTSPGELRTARLSGEAFVVGSLSARVAMRASSGVRAAPGPSANRAAAASHGPVVLLESDRLAANGRRCTVLGTQSADEFRSYVVPGGPQVYCGLGGDDRISGGSANDVLDGGEGMDLLLGGAGDDRIYGGVGADTLAGGEGRDDLRGGPGGDDVRGASGSDRLAGGPGRDRLVGGNGEDELSGGTGMDRLFGGAGRDRLHGGLGPDLLSGGSGNDFGIKGTGDRLVGIERGL